MGYDKTRFKVSFRALLTFFLSLALSVSGLIYSIYFHQDSKKTIESEMKEMVVVLSESLSYEVSYDLINGNTENVAKIVKESLQKKDVVQVLVTDLTGETIAFATADPEKKIDIPAKVLNTVETSKEAMFFEAGGRDYIIASRLILLDSDFIDKYGLVSLRGSEGKKGYAKIVFSMENVKAGLQKRFNATLYFIIFITVAGVFIMLAFFKIIFKPINEIVALTARMAEGDLTFQASDSIISELSLLSRSINTISEKLAVVLKRILYTVNDITIFSDSIQWMSVNLQKGSKEQASSVDMTFESVKDINTSIEVIAGKLGGLISSAGATSESMKEMSTSISTISDNTTLLADSIGNSSSSIIEMTSSIKEIVNSTDELSKFMAKVKGSINDLGKAIHTVTTTSKEACDLSEKVKSNASDTGLRSVEQMSASMDKIKESVEHSSYTIKKLGDTSNQIGDILIVIESVTEQTDLLALNAAILAAQAGKRGKGFAVVADEIKALADRTNSSTKEIANIINDIRHDVKSSIKAVAIGRENVSEGVKQTGQVVKAFEYIYSSASSSLDKTDEIKNSSIAQAEQVESIKQTINTMNNMVLQVVNATKEQKSASEHVMRMTEDISGITNKIKDATLDQSKQSRLISGSLNSISDEIREIGDAVNKKAEEVANVSKATDKVKEIADQYSSYNKDLSGVATKFLKLSKTLKEEISHFTLKDDK